MCFCECDYVRRWWRGQTDKGENRFVPTHRQSTSSDLTQAQFFLHQLHASVTGTRCRKTNSDYFGFQVRASSSDQDRTLKITRKWTYLSNIPHKQVPHSPHPKISDYERNGVIEKPRSSLSQKRVGYQVNTLKEHFKRSHTGT